MRIDSHQHFWRYSPEEYGWIDSSMVQLQRDYLPEDLKPELGTLGIEGSIAVQARQTVEETHRLLSLAGQNGWIRGVVGWLPLASENIHKLLEELTENELLKGVRHVIQDEREDDFMLGAAFNSGLALLHRYQLPYDLLILERHLPYTLAIVDRHPKQLFILDHIAKPRIAGRELQPWADQLRKLAERPNVSCKLSGMVTEAHHGTWRKEDLRPFFDVTLEAFGPERIMFGSDWPVCLLASSYTRWFEVVTEWISPLTTSEQAAILGGTAARAYRL